MHLGWLDMDLGWDVSLANPGSQIHQIHPAYEFNVYREKDGEMAHSTNNQSWQKGCDCMSHN